MRQVLLGLGLEDKELSDMPDVFGVEWRLGPKFQEDLESNADLAPGLP